jgi:hypothetical protein
MKVIGVEIDEIEVDYLEKEVLIKLANGNMIVIPVKNEKYPSFTVTKIPLPPSE